MLILCLLVSFKAISQTGTENKVVVLTERQAKEVIKDLIRYDALVKVDSLKDEKIKNLDEIIALKDDTIDKQKRFIDGFSKPRFSGFIGAENKDLEMKVNVYGAIKFDVDKLNVSARYYFNKTNNCTINVEYKLF